ncbi:SRPBCC family protein [Paenibacillus sp. SAF-054]|uniref:SRPBCC family protein n=1 Tax=unclassified Paenibacillus TaxID=185978 RepID=UPI003F81F21C
MSSSSHGILPDIRHTAIFNASIHKVWDAVATSDGLEAWFMPNDFEPIVGYEFHINAGPFGMSPCRVIEVEPPRHLSFRWGKDWTLSFELREVDGQTEVTIIHSGWNENTVTEFGQPHPAVRGVMDQGWAGLHRKLGAYVEA